MFNQEFYRHAEAYDMAFSFRNIPLECDFLEWCFKEHAAANVLENRHYLDICAGPSPHGIELAKRGWHSVAVDLSDDMKEYAFIKAGREHVHLEYILGDIREFCIPRPCALAGCYIDSLTHLTTNEDIVRHFQAMQRNMLSGGLYIIELAHPRYIFPATEPNVWKVQSGDQEVEMLYGLPDDFYDSVSQIWELTSRLTVRNNSQIVETIERMVKHRFYMCQELKALIDLSGVFDLCTFYDALTLPPESLVHKSKGNHMIAVLRFK